VVYFFPYMYIFDRQPDRYVSRALNLISRVLARTVIENFACMYFEEAAAKASATSKLDTRNTWLRLWLFTDNWGKASTFLSGYVKFQMS